MAHLELHAFIQATPERVWAVLEDFERQTEWMVDLRKLTVVSQHKRGVGTRLDATSSLFGLPLVKDMIEVTVWEPGRRMEVRRDTPAAGFGRFALRGTGAFVLVPAAGGTMFTWTEDFTPPLGALGELVYVVVLRPYLRRVFGRSMANVRRLAVEWPNGKW
jgi:hypothetical protein